MPTIDDLQEQRDRASARMLALFGTDENTGRIKVKTDKPWTSEDQEAYDSALQEVESIDQSIANLKKAQEVLESQNKSIEARNKQIVEIADRANVSLDEAAHSAEEKNKVFNTWLREGPDGFMRNDESFRRYQNVLQVGTDTKGGHTIPIEVRGVLLQKMYDHGGMRPVANVQTSMTGREIAWPTMDETAQRGEIVAEGSAATEQEPQFGQKSIKFDMYSSKIVKVSRQLLQDSTLDIDSLVLSLLATRLARTQADFMTNGSTTTGHEVRGVIEDAGNGYTAPAVSDHANRTAITFEFILNLIHSLDPYYRKMGGMLMFKDAILLKLKGIKDGDSRPLWLPSVGNDSPNMIYGYPYHINQAMPDQAANAYTMLFGDYMNYLILDAMPMEIFRFADESDYATKQEVGFVVFCRTASRLVDQSGESVRRFRQST